MIVAISAKTKVREYDHGTHVEEVTTTTHTDRGVHYKTRVTRFKDRDTGYVFDVDVDQDSWSWD